MNSWKLETDHDGRKIEAFAKEYSYPYGVHLVIKVDDQDFFDTMTTPYGAIHTMRDAMTVLRRECDLKGKRLKWVENN